MDPFFGITCLVAFPYIHYISMLAAKLISQNTWEIIWVWSQKQVAQNWKLNTKHRTKNSATLGLKVWHVLTHINIALLSSSHPAAENGTFGNPFAFLSILQLRSHGVPNFVLDSITGIKQQCMAMNMGKAILSIADSHSWKCWHCLV